MPTFRAVSSARGNIAGIVRAFEINLGIEAGTLGPRLALGLGSAVARGVAGLVLVEELVTLYQVLAELDAETDRIGAERIRARELAARADQVAARIARIEAGLEMPPMWRRDP